MVLAVGAVLFLMLNVSLVSEAQGQQSRYCQSLAHEAETMEAQWLTINSERLKANEAVLEAEYVFAPIYQIQLVSTPGPYEMCRRANTQLSKKAASLCYCRGSQSYMYSPFDTLDSCEIEVDPDSGNMYAYMAGHVQCM